MFLKSLFTFFLITFLTYSFEINSLEFDKQILKRSKVSKTFTLKNSSDDSLIYNLSILNDNDVQVYPKQLIILPNKEKSFTITVLGNKKQGFHKYNLIIEKKIVTNKKIIKTNMTFHIKQKYEII